MCRPVEPLARTRISSLSKYAWLYCLCLLKTRIQSLGWKSYVRIPVKHWIDFFIYSHPRRSKHSAGAAGNIWSAKYKRASLLLLSWKVAMVSLLKIYPEIEKLGDFTLTIHIWEDSPSSNYVLVTEYTFLWVRTTEVVLRNKLMWWEKLQYQSRRYLFASFSLAVEKFS